MELIHGGDIYSARARMQGEILDFSANLNPLGLPEGVRRVLAESADACACYPDPLCRELCAAIAAHEGVPKEIVLCGNGAADLIFRLCQALRPHRALILAPTFAEYEQALRAVGCEVERHYLNEADEFCLTETILERLTPGLDLVFLCNPNNPTGQVADPGLMEEILLRCGQNGILLAADECFVDFLDEPGRHTLRAQLGESRHLLILRAFTKIYAMAGLRLGYCLCSDGALLERMAECGQPWSVSVPAQLAGVQALREHEYLKESAALIRSEREYLRRGLLALGFGVMGSRANYIFFRSPVAGLRGKLERENILIRSCKNYPGLDGRYYRVAVRTRRENSLLLAALRDCVR